MNDLGLIVVSTVLVNNIVLTRFFGLCPFMGVSHRLETAAGMALTTGFVLTLSAILTYLLYSHALIPLGLAQLKIILFLLVIAGVVQFTEMIVHRTSPLLYQVLGIYLPLIASNCAVLGVSLINIDESESFLEAVIFGIGTAAGFALVLILFTALRERIAAADVPGPFKGAAIGLIAAGMMSLAFMGFAGLA
ncbi:MAG: electron transport complex subunit RsxA [Gammaproteobacteria bacterium]